jgi:hypothetical protein
MPSPPRRGKHRAEELINEYPKTPEDAVSTVNAHGYYPLSNGNEHRGCTDRGDPGPCDCLCHLDEQAEVVEGRLGEALRQIREAGEGYPIAEQDIEAMTEAVHAEHQSAEPEQLADLPTSLGLKDLPMSLGYEVHPVTTPGSHRVVFIPEFFMPALRAWIAQNTGGDWTEENVLTGLASVTGDYSWRAEREWARLKEDNDTLQTENERLAEAAIELQKNAGTNSLRMGFRAMVADTAMRYAVRYGWCDQVLEALREMGIELEVPKVRVTAHAVYEFEAEVPFSDINRFTEDAVVYLNERLRSGPLFVKDSSGFEGVVVPTNTYVAEAEVLPTQIKDKVSDERE